MAGRPATLKVDIVADAKNAIRGIDQTDSRMSRLGKSAGLLGKVAGGVALGGIAALGAGLVAGVKSAADYETLSNKLAGTIKSTGNAANVSVAGLQSRAGALESLSGVDEELILSGQNVLLTFTNIHNSVGKGNDVFDRATKAALGMSITLGTDMSSASVQLGKALNDPIKGITALGKSGVSFTEQQKEQIKTLVESGDQMGAQKIILGELDKEFGNAAEAAGTGFNGALARVKDLVGDTARNVGTALLPMLTTAGTWLVEKGAPAAARFADELGQRLGPFVSRVGAFIRDDLIPAGTKLYGWIVEKIVPAVVSLYSRYLSGLLDGFQSIKASIDDNSEGLGKLGRFLAVVIPPAARILAAVLGTVLGTAFRILGTVIGGIIGMISQLVNLIDSAVDKIRGLASLAQSVGSGLGKLNPFSSGVVVGMTPALTGPAALTRPGSGIATAAWASAAAGAGALTGGRTAGLAGGVTYVDARQFTATIEGEVVDRVGAAIALRELLEEHAARTGAGSAAWA